MLPKLLTHGGPILWLLILTGSVAFAVVVERLLHYHREQINSAEFLSGVRNVLKRDNVVEALSICEATPGPVARLVKTAIINRNLGRDGVRESLEEAGSQEVPRLEEKLNLLATVAQVSPLIGLFGTTVGFIRIFAVVEKQGPAAHFGMLSGGVWEAMISTAAGLGVAIFAYCAYNFLVSRVNAIVLDMEKTSTEILNLVTEIKG